MGVCNALLSIIYIAGKMPKPELNAWKLPESRSFVPGNARILPDAAPLRIKRWKGARHLEFLRKDKRAGQR